MLTRGGGWGAVSGRSESLVGLGGPGDQQGVLASNVGGKQATLGLLRPFPRLLGWVLPIACIQLCCSWGYHLDSSEELQANLPDAQPGKKGSELALSWQGCVDTEPLKREAVLGVAEFKEKFRNT